MLYHLAEELSGIFSALNVFKYQTFRSGGAVMTSLILSLLIGGRFIAWLKSLQKHGQPIRTDGPASHLLTKQGTPTMGGSMILLTSVLSTMLWADLSNQYVWIVVLTTLGFGALGLMDDYAKLTRRSSKGVSARGKLLAQIAISLIATVWIIQIAPSEMRTHMAVPFFKDVLINLSWFYIIFTCIVIVGSSNAVNLTDGLDGLAIVPVIIAAGCFALIAYLAGNALFADYLQIHQVKGSGEVAIFCASIIGAGLGFLWYNAPPARVFMGDTGSLALGGALGVISVITKHELVLGMVGGLFVIEALSVIIQVAYFKRTGKRVFLMAPIHHHFEKKGWSEPTIVIRFWIIAVIFALIGLSTLKLR